MQKVVLNNGVEMPILGFGVYQSSRLIWLRQRLTTNDSRAANGP